MAVKVGNIEDLDRQLASANKKAFECSEGSEQLSLVTCAFDRSSGIQTEPEQVENNTRKVRHNSHSPDDLTPEPFLEQGNRTASARTPVDLSNGYDPYVLVPNLWKAIENGNHPPRLFFNDAGDLVRLEVVDSNPRQIDLSIDRLLQEVHRVAEFLGSKGRPRSCPRNLIQEMRAVPFSTVPLPRLRQIATAPLVADDTGRIIHQNGYYRDLGIFVWCSDKMPAIPYTPTRSDVRRALAILHEPQHDFPFVNAASRATAMAVMITPFVRRLIKGPTPLHLIEKATPGTGATLLSEVLLTPSVGAAVQKLMPPKSDHEWEYSLGAILRSLPIAVVIDNARSLISPQLAKALTDDVMVARIVGSSSIATMPVLCVWVSTGNNPKLHQEIARRTVRCRLDAGVERPWLRSGYRIPKMKEWLHEHRVEMIWAVLTCVRSWIVSGQPMGKRVLGMFESYSETLGGILAHLEIDDFLDKGALAEHEEEDLQTEAERWLITGWWQRHGTSMVHVRDLIEWVEQADSPVLELWGPEVASDSYAKRLGWLLKEIKGKTIKTDATAQRDPGPTVKVRRCDPDPETRTARYQLQPVEGGVTEASG
jgi:hypothetical protein